MVITRCPGFRHGLRSFDRPDIVRFSKIVPTDDLDDVDVVPVFRKHFESLSEEPLVRVIHPVLVVRVWSIVLYRS